MTATVTITMPDIGECTITLSNVRLDVREGGRSLSRRLSGDSNAFVSGVENVISDDQRRPGWLVSETSDVKS